MQHLYNQQSLLPGHDLKRLARAWPYSAPAIRHMRNLPQGIKTGIRPITTHNLTLFAGPCKRTHHAARVPSKSRVSQTSRALYASPAKRPLTRPDLRDNLSPRERDRYQNHSPLPGERVPDVGGQVRGLFEPHRTLTEP